MTQKLSADQRRYFERRIREVLYDVEHIIKNDPAYRTPDNPASWGKLRAHLGDTEFFARLEKRAYEMDEYKNKGIDLNDLMTKEDKEMFPCGGQLTDEAKAKIREAHDLAEEAMDAVMLGNDAAKALKDFRSKADALANGG